MVRQVYIHLIWQSPVIIFPFCRRILQECGYLLADIHASAGMRMTEDMLDPCIHAVDIMFQLCEKWETTRRTHTQKRV